VQLWLQRRSLFQGVITIFSWRFFKVPAELPANSSEEVQASSGGVGLITEV
jgi:hypothetical protein